MSVQYRHVPFYFLVFILALQFGCLKAAPEDVETEEGRKEICEYWPEKLTSPTKVDKAFKLITEAKCVSALPKLEELFNKDVERSRIVDALREIGDKGASVGILRAALKDSSVASKAATIAASWRLSELTDDLVKFTEESEEHRRAGLDALLSVSDAQKHEDLLIGLTKTNPNVQDLKVNEKALNALAKIGSKKGTPAIVAAAFMRNTNGKNIYPAARLALAKLPKEAAVSLAKVEKGTQPVVKQMAKSLNLANWKIQGNQILAQLLADTLDHDAALPLAKILAKQRTIPMGLSKRDCETQPSGRKCKQYKQWDMHWINQHQYAHLGFAKLPPNAEAAAELTKLVMAGNAPGILVTHHRLFAANALSYMGSPEAIKGLWKAWDEDPDWPTLGKDMPPKDKRKGADFLGLLTRPLVMAIGYEDLPELEKRWAKPLRYNTVVSPANSVATRMNLPNTQAVLGAIKECKIDGACWIKTLEENKMTDTTDRDLFIKATLMLTRSFVNASDARKALLSKLKSIKDNKPVDFRKFCLNALARIGDKKTGEELVNLSKDPSVGKQTWKDHYAVVGNALLARNK